MVFSSMNKECKVVIVNCDCGCEEAIQIKKYTFDEEVQQENEYYISILAGQFYTKQMGIFKLIIHRIKLAWKMLIGKEYLLNEIIVSETELKQLKRKIQEL